MSAWRLKLTAAEQQRIVHAKKVPGKKANSQNRRWNSIIAAGVMAVATAGGVATVGGIASCVAGVVSWVPQQAYKCHERQISSFYAISWTNDCSSWWISDLGVIASCVAAALTFGTACCNMLQALKKSDHEDLECFYQVKDEVHNLVAFVEKAHCFYDKIVCVLSYLWSESMADVKEGLSRSTPDLKPLHNWIAQLVDSLEDAKTMHSELRDACKAAKNDCHRAAKNRACKEREFQGRKQKNKIGGGTAAA